MEENKPLVTETEFPESDTDIISGDGTPIIDTSDQNVGTVQEEKNTSGSDAEENTKDSSTTNTEENGVEEDTTTEIVTDPANDPATLESALLVSTYAALNKLADYVPTEYVNNSEPDIDAEHLNNTEQGLLRVTNLLNGAVDVINDLQTTVAKQASAIETLNSKMWTRHQILIPSVTTNSNGYASVGQYKPSDAPQYFVSIVANWHSTKPPYGISGNLMFLMGEPNTTYSEVSIDCWY